jgi:hypothetical protein
MVVFCKYFHKKCVVTIVPVCGSVVTQRLIVTNKLIRKLTYCWGYIIRNFHSLKNSAFVKVGSCYLYKICLMVIHDFDLQNAWI